MRQHVAPLDLCQTLFHLADEPLVIIDDLFDRFARHGFGIAAPLRSQCARAWPPDLAAVRSSDAVSFEIGQQVAWHEHFD
jgi:hypothetical protein